MMVPFEIFWFYSITLKNVLSSYQAWWCLLTHGSDSSEGGRKVSSLQKVGASLANIVRLCLEGKDLSYM